MKLHKVQIALLALTLSACGKTVVQERPVTVRVPVAQPCALERPPKVETLKTRTPDWDTLDIRQKSAWVARQALDLRTAYEQLDAATGACR